MFEAGPQNCGGAFDDPDVKTSPATLAGQNRGIKRRSGAGRGYIRCGHLRQQVGPVELSDKIKNGSAGDVVFQKRTSLVFKKLQVVRFYDAKRNTWPTLPTPTK